MNIPERFYHVTTADSYDQIMREGLLPRLGQRSQDFGEVQPAIYLFPSINALQDALWLAEAFDDEEDLVVLCVQAEGISNPLPSFMDDESWEWRTEQAIGKEHLSRSDIRFGEER